MAFAMNSCCMNWKEGDKCKDVSTIPDTESWPTFFKHFKKKEVNQ
jgi:hypothetical protein